MDRLKKLEGAFPSLPVIKKKKPKEAHRERERERERE